jgi:imidazolonepropionase-like amidohydrolase
MYGDPREYGSQDAQPRALAQYLYAGVTTVKSVGDALDTSIALRDRVARAEILGAELLISGPMFTAPGGHGTEYAQFLPATMRASFEAQIARTPKNQDEARQQVRDLKRSGVDGLKAILESGFPGRLFERLDTTLLKAIGEEARAQQLPMVVHVSTVRDVADALDAGAAGIEHGPREPLPDDLLQRLKQSGATYDPTLAVWEGQEQLAAGQQDLLDRSLVQQAVAPALVSSTRAFVAGRTAANEGRATGMRQFRTVQAENLKRAYDAGVTLVAGSDAGNPLVFHGPAIHRELQLWVAAGVPPAAALQAATAQAARLLKAETRIGRVAKGLEANLLLVDGNPLQDISTTERISLVVFKGERIRRAVLFTAGQTTAP